MPDVEDRRLSDREEHGAPLGRAVSGASARAVLVVDRAIAAEPRGVTASAGEAPRAAHPVAAVDHHRARLGPRSPREDRAGRTEYLLRRRRGQIRRRHRASGGLTETPGRAGIGPGNLQDDLRKRAGIDLAATEGARQEHVEEPGIDQLGDEGGRQPPVLLDQRGIGLDFGRERARARDVVFSKLHALDLSRLSHRSAALRSSSPVHRGMSPGPNLGTNALAGQRGGRRHRPPILRRGGRIAHTRRMAAAPPASRRVVFFTSYNPGDRASIGSALEEARRFDRGVSTRPKFDRGTTSRISSGAARRPGGHRRFVARGHVHGTT